MDLTDKITLLPGDMREVLPGQPADSVDSCITDPPYHLASIVKRFGKEGSAPAQYGTDGRFARASRGFMGKEWDGGEIAFEPETWAAVYRVLKPGGHLLAFGAPKNFGFMQNAIAWAGFEVRDVICWLFGSGFPKSHNAGGGWGTALKPAFEPIIMARKPLSESTVAANVLKWGTGAINVDGCRVASGESTVRADCSQMFSKSGKRDDNGRPALNRAPTGSDNGRWPANVLHDGSEEVVAAFPESDGCQPHKINSANREYEGWGSITNKHGETVGYEGKGSAARFFYTAKADSDDRLGSKHPTVKPVDLMQWLVRLVTPKGGLVLDPFAGTGTTGEAAFREGMRAILIEREEEYQADIHRRIKLMLAGPDERKRESIKAKGETVDAGPLFGSR